MQYMGSKNRFAKELVPIIQSYITNETVGYLEPFVGGANIIDKIKCDKRIGNDIHKHLIALLKHSQETVDDLPETILFEEYDEVRSSLRNNDGKYEDWYYGLVGFCGSFGNRFFDGGYARNSKEDTNGKRVKQSIDNLKKQHDKLKNIKFINKSFLDLPKDKIKGYVIYCDPPYRDTKKYSNKEPFPYEEFYDWCRDISTKNVVLVSEYNMPDDFKCIWEKKTTTQIDSLREANSNKNERIERLYILNNN